MNGPWVRRNARLVSTRPTAPFVFRVKSRSEDATYLAVINPNGDSTCNCVAGSFRAKCYHRQRAEASARRRGLVS